MVTCSHFSTRIAVERARYAAERGASLLMLMPPYHGSGLKADEAQPHVSSGCLTPTSRRFRRDGRKFLSTSTRRGTAVIGPHGDREVQARCRPPLNTRLTRIVSSTELNCSCGYANARCFGRAITIEAAPQASRHSTPLSRRPPWPASEASSSFLRRGRKSRSLHLQRQKNLSG